jgi:hypothetical protein
MLLGTYVTSISTSCESHNLFSAQTSKLSKVTGWFREKSGESKVKAYLTLTERKLRKRVTSYTLFKIAHHDSLPTSGPFDRGMNILITAATASLSFLQA